MHSADIWCFPKQKFQICAVNFDIKNYRWNEQCQVLLKSDYILMLVKVGQQ
jgi:hypothetical protein